jgi:hypothetical protein
MDDDDQPTTHGPDWPLLGSSHRPNVMIIGDSRRVLAVSQALEASCRTPIHRWPDQGPPWNLDHRIETLILEEPASLSEDEQAALMAWMAGSGLGVQVISYTAERLYPLVERQEFSAPLFYRLNQVCVDDRS